MKIVGIHQPNCVPWFPFFEKMAVSDMFVVLTQCQFTKNGYQNRYKIRDNWVTKPVKKSKCAIYEKEYQDGQSLRELNMDWIKVMAKTMSIDTNKIVEDWHTENVGTDRLIEIIEECEGTHYVTNPSAFDKYLEKSLFYEKGIEIIPLKTQYPYHTFKMWEDYGIDKCTKMLQKLKDKTCKIYDSSSLI